MNLDLIKAAINDGVEVFWKSKNYKVKCDKHGQWVIVFAPTGHCVGLTRRDGTLIESPDSFFILG